MQDATMVVQMGCPHIDPIFAFDAGRILPMNLMHPFAFHPVAPGDLSADEEFSRTANQNGR
jgi:hypothetical protein